LTPCYDGNAPLVVSETDVDILLYFMIFSFNLLLAYSSHVSYAYDIIIIIIIIINHTEITVTLSH